MPKTPLEIAQDLRPALARLNLLYFRQADSYTISLAQMSIMTILDETGPMRISQIAQGEAIRMPTASNAVNQLESMGLVSRVRDVSDRRGVSVQLTEKGKEELIRSGENRNVALARMIENLTPEEVAQVEKAAPLINLILNRYTEAHSKD